MRSLALLAALIAAYIAIFPTIEVYSKNRLGERDVRYIPPKEILELSTLEFKALAADLLFFEGLTFVGGRKSGDNDPDTWEWLYKILDASSYLNPHNVDPYFIAQGFLTWEGRMFKETNELLNRGLTYRTNDWRLPFFIGFNYYFFLDQPEKGAQYLEMAARLPESPRATLLILASRLYTMSARTELAIAIVKDDYERTRDEALRKIYKNRLKSLQARFKIEQAVEAYEKRYKQKPASLAVLLEKGLLKEIPSDPEGGSFFLDDSGRVKNTRDVAIEKKTEIYRFSGRDY